MESEVGQLLQQGDRGRAFEKILSFYDGKVFRLVFSMLGNATQAQDVTQDVFLKIWQSIQTFDCQRASLATWIYTIARNTAISHLRSEAYRRTRPLEEISGRLVATSAGQELDIRRMVEKLPEELRAVIVLYYYQERSVDDVALMLSLPSGTVKSHLFRARKMLLESMTTVRNR